jgi:hypothetical protein
LIKGGRTAYGEALSGVAALGDTLGDLVHKATQNWKQPRTLRLRAATPHRKRARKLRRKIRSET